MANISPGVYSKIIDLSTFVQNVPSTIGFFCGIAEKGRDNELVFLSDRSEFISEFGEPNIQIFGKNYGQNHYFVYNFLGESATYYMRVLPDDATYANFRIDVATSDTTSDVSIVYVDSMNSATDLKSTLNTNATGLCMLYPIGRGEYYNKIGVRITEYSNPFPEGIYVLDIYEKQSDDTNTIIESFEVSFDPNAKDLGGDSIFIEYVLETYSKVLRCEMMKTSEAYSDGYDNIIKIYDNEIGVVSVVESAATAAISDTNQDFSDWEDSGGTGQYVVIAMDGRGNKIWGWLGAAYGDDNESCYVYNDKNLAVAGWNGSVSDFDETTTITYTIRKNYASIAQAFISSDPVPLKRGSDGTLKTASGALDTTVAAQLIGQGFAGLIDDTVLDTENLYFSAVFDGGYSNAIKTQIVSLCQTRKDCVCWLDNGDNSTYADAIASRQNVNDFNTYYAAIYEPYSKVYDVFTGQYVWFSPIYHMSYLVPRNDNVSELWYAVAGYDRASLNNVKDLRFNPRLTQRDQFYLKQLNPIVKFSAGEVVWGQLTSQAKSSKLQNINVVRLVLYCQKALKRYCDYFIFEQNDALTWSRVSQNIIGFLEDIKRRRGLHSYEVSVGATDYQLKTKTFGVDIVLYPITPAERIELNFYIK
jgi:hypothetical protein